MSWKTLNPQDRAAADLPLWRELLCGVEAALLHAAPVYYGLGAPLGDKSGVIVIPGFLGTDAYLVEMYAWLHRMNYRPYFSDIGINAECPNLLVRRRLNSTIDRAVRETGGRIHLIGHSLGGMIALSAAIQRPQDVASVITLGSPFRGKVIHSNVLRLAEMVRGWIKTRHGESVLPDCFTGQCSCDFVSSLRLETSALTQMTAIYTRTDGVVDWQYSVTGDPELDFEVPGTHIGLAFNPSAYLVMAKRLAQACERVH